jgi:hypothetical protein
MLHVDVAGAILAEKALNIRKNYAAFRENRDASISEIHDFVKKMPALTKEYKSLNQVRSYTTHTHAYTNRNGRVSSIST